MAPRLPACNSLIGLQNSWPKADLIPDIALQFPV
jgi:hypothetical protein